jgi:4-aminobutyrate aminotransferase / (S)-3-amino-2-methylpropionate transaminase / 5-aminovalerate transaminase
LKTKTVVQKTEIPGPRSRELMEQVAKHTPKSLGHATPLGIASAKGALVTDLDGNTYIDFTGGIGTLNMGHCPPAVVDAIKDQAEQYLHTCFMVLAYPSYVELAAKLNAITPGSHEKKTVLFNSGAEAVENAIKVARAFTGRSGVIVFDRAFHGRTMLALGLTGQVKPYKVGFGPFPGDIYRVPYPYEYRCPVGREDCECDLSCLQPLEQLFRCDMPPERVAAIILEPVLGEGGFVVPPDTFLPHLRALCDQHGILLIADEVQTGFGRTGKMFAVDHWGVVPDLLVTAKSLGGGTPISALTGRAEILDALVTGSLGGTYGGNPLACRAALAAIETLERERLVERAAELGERVAQRLVGLQQRYHVIGEVRWLGCMIGIELADTHDREPASALAAQLIGECMQRGLLLLKSGAGNNVIRTLMPLVITDEQVDEALEILEASFAAISKGEPS